MIILRLYIADSVLILLGINLILWVVGSLLLIHRGINGITNYSPPALAAIKNNLLRLRRISMIFFGITHSLLLIVIYLLNYDNFLIMIVFIADTGFLLGDWVIQQKISGSTNPIPFQYKILLIIPLIGLIICLFTMAFTWAWMIFLINQIVFLVYFLVKNWRNDHKMMRRQFIGTQGGQFMIIIGICLSLSKQWTLEWAQLISVGCILLGFLIWNGPYWLQFGRQTHPIASHSPMRSTIITKKRIRNLVIVVGLLMIISNLIPIYAHLSRLGRNIDPSKQSRYWEPLGRGELAFNNSEGQIYLSWRLLDSDPIDIGFHIYRQVGTNSPVRLTSTPIVSTTDYLDISPPTGSEFFYQIRPVIDASENPATKNITVSNVLDQPYLSFPLQESEIYPSGEVEYAGSRVAIGDLDGDGNYDFVIKRPNIEFDPFTSWQRSITTYKLEAYKSDGQFLWWKDLGWDIELGIWYSPYITYDFDMDGKAEVATKISVGDHRDPIGKVQEGPEAVVILEGDTGQELARAPWPPRKAQIYNFNSRNLLGVAYLDGHRPYLIIVRGTYGEIQVDALNFTGTSLSKVWTWDSFHEWGFFGINRYLGQGAHYLHAADVDADGCDEIVLGGCVLDQTGIPLWSTGHKHADHCYVGEIDPTHPGLEIYYGIEGILDFFPEYGWGIEMADARTGDILWQVGETTTHIHDQGLVSDIDARFPGMECYSGEKGPRRWLHTANGTLIANQETFDVDDSPKAVFWDADPQRELLVNGRIFKFESDTTLGPPLSGKTFGWVDLLGDWREEVVTIVENELRIYSTTIPATNRHICLMRDPIYRIDIAHFSVGYPQVPMLSASLE